MLAQVGVKNTIATKKHQAVCLTYSTDGKYLITGGIDKKISAWSAESGDLVRTFKGLKAFPLELTISSDNQHLISGGKDKKVSIWNFESGELIQILSGHSKDITTVSIAPDDALIASGSKDKSIIIWELATGAVKFKLKGHTKAINSVVFNRDGSKLLSGSADGTMKEWNTTTGKLLRTIDAHDGWVRCAAYSPTGTYIASGGDDNKIKIWNNANGKLQNTILSHSKWVETLQFSPNGQYIASGGHDNYLLLIEASTGKVVFNSKKRENYILSVGFNPNGKELASTALFSKNVTIWNLASLGIEKAEVKQQVTVPLLAPEVKWGIGNNNRTQKLTQKLKFSIKTEHPENNVEVSLNDNLSDKFTIKNTQGAWKDIEKTVFLNRGKNKLVVTVYYEDKMISTEELTITYETVPTKLTSVVATTSLSKNQDVEITKINTIVTPLERTTEPVEKTIPKTIVKVVTKAVKETTNGDINQISFTNDANPYRFALIIGNEDYSSYQVGLDNEVNVDFAVNDATTFRTYANQVFGVPSDNIIFLTNARAIEMDNAIFKIKSIIKALNGKAEVLVYYAGHGFPHEKTKEPYLIPVDVTATNLKFAVKLNDLFQELNEYPSARINFFIDACFSGGARNVGLVSARGMKVKPKANQLSGNFVVLTASSANQASLAYKDKKHGIFTYYLLSKLKESKGELTYKELSDYVIEQVGVRSALINSKEQTPQINVSPSVKSNWSSWSVK